MCMVEVRNGNLDAAYKILKRKVEREGVLTDLRKHEFYKKPSVKKREKHMAAVRRAKKKNDKKIFDKKEWYEARNLERAKDEKGNTRTDGERKPFNPNYNKFRNNNKGNYNRKDKQPSGATQPTVS